MESSAPRYRAILGLGSNLGSREAFLRAGILEVAREDSISLEAVSDVYLSEPMGPAQPQYLNMAIRITTSLVPVELLDRVLGVEARLGRTREIKWGPRVLDIDILWAEGQASVAPRLHLPHEGLLERNFALGPLLDVLPDPPHGWESRLVELGGRPEIRWAWRNRDGVPPSGWCWGVDEVDAVAEAFNTSFGTPEKQGKPHLHRLVEDWPRSGWALENLKGLLRSEICPEFLTFRADDNSMELQVFGTLQASSQIGVQQLRVQTRRLRFGAEARLVSD